MKRQNGDTLVEVVFSIAIISAALITALSVANMSLRASIQARERTKGIYLAQEQVELLKLYRDQRGEADASFGMPGAVRISGSGTVSPTGPYMVSRFYQVTVAATGANRADVRVRWESILGGQTLNDVYLSIFLEDSRGFTIDDCSVATQC